MPHARTKQHYRNARRELIEKRSFPPNANQDPLHQQYVGRKPPGRYCPIELAVEENTLFALPPINRIVPTTKTKMTASITAYSAISWPSSCNQSLRSKSVMIAPPCNSPRLYTPPLCRGRNRLSLSLRLTGVCAGRGNVLRAIRPPSE